MHSPFVFDFILHVLNNKKNYQPPVEIEILRKQFLNDDEEIKLVELGAGSRKGNSSIKKVSSIAATALKNKKLAQVLFRLARHYQPGNIIELGTSLGITTAYLASSHSNATVYTIEGNPQIRKKAMEGFDQLGLKNIHSFQGNFDDVVPGVLERAGRVDLGYIDGNHRLEPTLRYFHWMLERIEPHSILVFDDIHWSREMEEAWEQVKSHPSVQYTIDIFFLGFVFFRKEFRLKQDFTIRF